MDRFLRSNAFLRVIALVMACILWLSVNAPNGGGTPAAGPVVRSFPYPVRVEVASDMTVSGIDNPTVMVEVVTDAVNVSNLTAQMLGVTVVADARGLSPGRHTLPLTVTGMPPVHYSINPPQVTVNLERRVSADVDVRVQVQGRPAAGSVVVQASADVQSAEVTGAQSAVSRVHHLAAVVTVDGMRASFTRQVELRPVTADGSPVAGVEVNPPSASVQVTMDPVVQRSFTALPVTVRNVSSGLRVAGLTPDVVDLTVTGPASAVDRLTPERLTVYVDAGGLGQGRHALNPKMDLPASIRIAGWSPTTVTVDLEPLASGNALGTP
ncbi:CdaR family protein [Alicyclobacillus sp.]|uniref:CdaR family protein n=1 Tax=Alicyclobacillus sp. TaxID=61169 RepID=UPI0025C158EB|nr:CdaR family protein [Alicyclobacillus sp.]MCL6516909.1 hypothetical protein [Alicyclobacillus sp.]